MLVLIFDTETNGLPKNSRVEPNSFNFHDWPHIVQLSYLLYDTESREIIMKHNYIIRVPKDVIITEESIRFHGITNEISEKEGAPIDGVLTSFYNNFKVADLVVAHNVEFDRKAILAEIYRVASIKTNTTQLRNMATDIGCAKKYYCTMQEGIELCNITAFTKIEKKEFKKYPTLSELCKHLFGYVPNNMHNAMNDVIVCFQCFYKMRFGKDICRENTDMGYFVQQLM